MKIKNIIKLTKKNIFFFLKAYALESLQWLAFYPISNMKIIIIYMLSIIKLKLRTWNIYNYMLNILCTGIIFTILNLYYEWFVNHQNVQILKTNKFWIV